MTLSLARLSLLMVVTAGIVMADGGTAQAAPPWARLSLFRRIEAQPGQMYAIDDSNGPWMVMAATFSGDHAEDEARELVYELRKKHKLDAYTHRMTFDFSQTLEGRDSNGDLRRMRYQNGGAHDEIAVLVGDFESVDDPRVPKLIERIKFMKPECLSDENPDESSLVLAGLRTIQRTMTLKSDDEGDQFVRNVKKDMGPMAGAFVTTNPLLPKNYFVPDGVDDFIEKINSDLQFSLLDCSGNYTIQVASFKGFSIVDPKTIEKVSHEETSSNLAAAAESAHRLTVKLREKGYEAYEYHERSRSIVTVGGFAQLGSQGGDGKFELDERIAAIAKTFGADPDAVAAGTAQPKSLDGIPFLPKPLVMEVPRRSIAADYSGSRFGR
ncbi:MAG: hypothetical protein R3C10_10250 [Pirellulales bacterium]|nr:hypothetical protein [Planctomycetales bacterium]